MLLNHKSLQAKKEILLLCVMTRPYTVHTWHAVVNMLNKVFPHHSHTYFTFWKHFFHFLCCCCLVYWPDTSSCNYMKKRTHLLPFNVKHTWLLFSVYKSDNPPHTHLGKSSSCHSSLTSMLSMRKVASAVPILSRGKWASAHCGWHTHEAILIGRKPNLKTYRA